MDSIQSQRSNRAAPSSEVAAPRRGRRALWLPVAVALATIGLIAWSAWPTLQPVRRVSVVQAALATQNAPIDQQPQDRGPTLGITKAVQAPGWLEAEPFYTACTALVDGVVAQVNVLEGQRVEADQVVARLVDDDAKLALRLAEAQLAAAKSALEVAKAERTAAQTDWDEPVEAERAVEAGLALVAKDQAELAQLPSLIDEAQAQASRFVEEHRRLKQLQPSGAVSELEVIVAREKVAESAARVESLKARKPLLEAKLAGANAQLKAAKRNLQLRTAERKRLAAARSAEAGAKAAVAAAQVDRDDAALQLKRTVIRAPISGHVSRRLVLPGDKVMFGMDSPHSAHVVHLYDPARLQVRVDVPLSEVAHVRVGQRCEVIVEVLPDQAFKGEVLRITHEADLQKNTLEVQVKVLNPSPLLRPEMLTRVKFLAEGQAVGREAEPRASAVRIPVEAIDTREGKQRVWVVLERRGDRGVIRPAPIKSVEPDGRWASVQGAVRPGDLLVLDFTKLQAGQRVRFDSAKQGGTQ